VLIEIGSRGEKFKIDPDPDPDLDRGRPYRTAKFDASAQMLAPKGLWDGLALMLVGLVRPAEVIDSRLGA
jgi:hypothetical protein